MSVQGPSFLFCRSNGKSNVRCNGRAVFDPGNILFAHLARVDHCRWMDVAGRGLPGGE